MPKRPPSPERVPLTDEWGIYDPAKAGMQALYARLGRPVLRASSKSVRQERRRGFRPERPSDGVGLAIEEAMRRAGILEEKAPADAPPVVPSAARAMRLALKAATAPKSAAEAIDAAAPPRRKVSRRTRPDTVATAAPVAETPPSVDAQAAVAEVESSVKARAPRRTGKARGKVEAAPAAPPPAAAEPPPAGPPTGPPAPSPRRPRGVVPLAAWAHTVTDAPAEPRRTDRRGFWRGIFRMPAEVALVEYARGCRIHRLLIETSDMAADSSS
jgi:hypothetical protein